MAGLFRAYDCCIYDRTWCSTIQSTAIHGMFFGSTLRIININFAEAARPQIDSLADLLSLMSEQKEKPKKVYVVKQFVVTLSNDE